MSKLKNNTGLASVFVIMILFVVSFFSLTAVPLAQAAAPACGVYDGMGTCANGTAKQLSDTISPLAHNWTCETAGNVPVTCSSLFGQTSTTPRDPSSSLTPSTPSTPSTPLLPPVLVPSNQSGTGLYVPVNNPINTSTPPMKCENPLLSDWVSLDQVVIPCCGALDGKWIDRDIAGRVLAGRMQASALCSSNNPGAAKNIRADNSELTWTCGAAVCKAYKRPECASELTQLDLADCAANNPVDKTKIYPSKDAYDDAINARKALGKDEFCESGVLSPDSCTMTANWRTRNKFYTCRTTKPGGRVEDTKMVRCGAGWAAPTTCGSSGKAVDPSDENDKGREYVAFVDVAADGKRTWDSYFRSKLVAAPGSANIEYSTGIKSDWFWSLGAKCQEDNNFIAFFNLLGEKGATELCPKGSKAINKAYYHSDIGLNTDYQRPDDSYDYQGLGSLSGLYKKYFNWQCQLDDGRNGAAIDCRASLESDLCNAADVKCGAAEDARLAYPGDGPVADFCALGKLEGRPQYGYVNIDRTGSVPVWKWRCVANAANEKPFGNGLVNQAECSVAASVYCGAAHNGIYDSKAKVLEAGPCVGDLLSDADIQRGRGTWDWTCTDAKNPTVAVTCSASNGASKCGYANGRSYQDSTMNANKATKDFLCFGNNSANGLERSQGLPASWTWTCGGETCEATVLECGQANTGHYTVEEFYDNRYGYGAFMCSNGNIAVREWRTSDDLGGGDAGDGYDPGWFWSCEGSSTKPGGTTDKLTYGSCTASEYRCGYFQWHSVKSALLADYRGEYERNRTKGDFFCTYGMVPENFRTNGAYTDWDCAHPDPTSPYEISCSTRHPNCGSAILAGNIYTKAELEAYLYKNLHDPLNPNGRNHKDDSVLCNADTTAVFPENLTARKGYLSWTCGGSPEFSQITNTAASLNIQSCEARCSDCY